jgi:hypothetical protein
MAEQHNPSTNTQRLLALGVNYAKFSRLTNSKWKSNNNINITPLQLNFDSGDRNSTHSIAGVSINGEASSKKPSDPKEIERIFQELIEKRDVKALNLADGNFKNLDIDQKWDIVLHNMRKEQVCTG